MSRILLILYNNDLAEKEKSMNGITVNEDLLDR